MRRVPLVPRVLILAAILVTALVASSCEGGSAGVGVGVGYPTRWGGGSSGPPVFVGGPSF